jgi:hypothetical protein
MLKKNEYNLINQDLLQKYIEFTKKYIVIQRQLEYKFNSSQKYKTELCKKFQSTGFCPYGNKCQFAHGKEELISKIQNANYKKRKCRSFYEKGYCPYGIRCNFQHDERKFKDLNFSYFYFRIYLLKYFGFLKSSSKYNEKAKIILNKRLNVFKSLCRNYSFQDNIKNQNNNMYNSYLN